MQFGSDDEASSIDWHCPSPHEHVLASQHYWPECQCPLWLSSCCCDQEQDGVTSNESLTNSHLVFKSDCVEREDFISRDTEEQLMNINDLESLCSGIRRCLSHDHLLQFFKSTCQIQRHQLLPIQQGQIMSLNRHFRHQYELKAKDEPTKYQIKYSVSLLQTQECSKVEQYSNVQCNVKGQYVTSIQFHSMIIVILDNCR